MGMVGVVIKISDKFLNYVCWHAHVKESVGPVMITLLLNIMAKQELRK